MVRSPASSTSTTIVPCVPLAARASTPSRSKAATSARPVASSPTRPMKRAGPTARLTRNDAALPPERRWDRRRRVGAGRDRLMTRTTSPRRGHPPRTARSDSAHRRSRTINVDRNGSRSRCGACAGRGDELRLRHGRNRAREEFGARRGRRVAAHQHHAPRRQQRARATRRAEAFARRVGDDTSAGSGFPARHVGLRRRERAARLPGVARTPTASVPR